jgi:hypothetical protein
MVTIRRLICEGRMSGRWKTRRPTGQQGFILIAAVALLTTLLGVVLLCLYPLAYEARQAPHHREGLRRMKAAEQGILGRLADQPGGQYSACGGYFSDLGPKMIVAEVANANGAGQAELEYALEFWYFRRAGEIPVLNQIPSGTTYTYTIANYPAGEKWGLTDIYRYDLQNGFWVGYRGKGYVAKPIGEEHMRKDVDIWDHEVPAMPRFTDGGFSCYVDLAGDYKASAVFLRTRPYLNIDYGYDLRLLEHRRYYNPVERLVVRLHDHRNTPTNLSALLIYAKQPDQTSTTSDLSIVPKLPSIVVVESSPQTSRYGSDTTFVFPWAPVSDPNNPDLVTGTDRGHTFEIGLKKLVLLENGIPVFACGIIIPPVRDYQCRPTGRYATECVQPYNDQYVVEVDYDG